MCFAVSRGDADGNIFQCAAEASHHVALKVRKNQHRVVIPQVRSDKIFLQMHTVCDRQCQLAGFIHDVTGCDIQKTVLLNGLPMLLCGVPPAFVSGIALNDGAVQTFCQRTNQRGLQKVMSARLSGRDFHCGLSTQPDAERIIETVHRLWCDLPCKIYPCFRHIASAPFHKKCVIMKHNLL